MTPSRARLIQIYALLVAWGVIVVIRLAYVQVVRHDHYTQRAQRQQEQTLAINAVRGSILDARGRILAESVAAQSIYADPQAVRDPRAVARRLAALPGLSVNAKEIEARLRSKAAFVWVARQVPLDAAARVKALSISGIYFLEEHRRSYPRGTLAANVIGYVGVDGEGLAGIEHSMDHDVRGRPGKVTLLRDARRGMYLVGGEGPNRPVDGHDVVLTIDSVVQFIAERALAKTIEQYRAAAGTAIVMDARDGSILAMASNPTFDPNHFRNSRPNAWRNRAVQDLYEPGSTFKVVAAAAGLQERLITPSQIVDCGNGSVRIANVEINEHGGHAWQFLPFEDVLVNSSNVGMVRIGNALGNRRLYDYCRKFGFGERTGISLPGEAQGLLRSPEKWSLVSSASISIGQEIGATPLQVVRAMGVIANGGLRVEPRIVRRVLDERGNAVHEQRPANPVRVISERTAAVMNEILKSVVRRGTGKNAALADHVVAGKTGTAQKAGRGGYSPDRFVASFAGYVPADRPRLVILVSVDEPRVDQYGGTIAAPAFREIAEAALRYLGEPPSLPMRSIDVEQPRLAAFSQRPAPAGRAAVPDVRGLDARAAVARATAAGLLVEAVGSGVVTSQKPMPGEAVPGGRRIMLTLAEGTL